VHHAKGTVPGAGAAGCKRGDAKGTVPGAVPGASSPVHP